MNHQEPQGHEGGLLERIAFSLLLIVVIARVFALETLRDPFEITPGAEIVPRTLTAAASVWFDWIACIPALLVLLSRAIARAPLVRSPSFLVLLALTVLAALSPIWSSDKFAAVVSVWHFIAGVAICFAAIQLVRDWTRLRIVAGVCFGLLLALVAYGLIYRFVELPDLRESVEKSWPQILAQRGWAPGSFMETQFRRKVLAGEMVGFNTSPNTFAAMIVMLLVVTIGALIERLRDRESRPWSAMIALAVPPTLVVLWFTQSRTAFVTPIIAIACFVALALFAHTLARHRKFVFITTIALIALGTIALIAYGLSRNELFHSSLTFRWRYWIGSMRVFTAHPFLGVGWNNFGDAYLPVREAIASEEIKDPHNLFVRFATELGTGGLLLSIAWLISLWWEMTRAPQPALAPHGRPERYSAPGGIPAQTALKPLTLIASFGILLNILFSIDFAQDASWVFLEVLKRLLYLALILIGLIVVTFRSFARQAIDDRPAPWIRRGILVALAVFLIHNLIDFSFFETGPMWIFMTLAGAMVGLTRERETSSRFTRPIAAVAAIAWTSHLVIACLITTCEMQAYAGDILLRGGKPGAAVECYRDAGSALPSLNSDYFYRAARALAYAGAPVDEIRRTIDQAIAANPSSPANYSFLARLEAQQPTPDMPRVIAAYNKFLALDPNDVQSRLQFAQSLDSAGMKTEAHAQYQSALEKDSQLEPKDPKRLLPEQVERIKSKLN